MGYDSLHALEAAGGLDALYVEPGVSQASSTSGTGTPVTISANQNVEHGAQAVSADARLHTITWDDESALALIFSRTLEEDTAVAAALSDPAPAAIAEPVLAPPPTPQAGHADAEELGAILDTAAEGIIMFDAQGNIHSCNRSAEALFGYDGDDFITAQSRRPVRTGKPARHLRLSREREIVRRREPARSRPRDARPRPPGRHHPAVGDDGPYPRRRPELLRRVPRPLADQEERGRSARGAAARRTRRQRQDRHAGADQPRAAHAAQRHHRLSPR